MVFMHKLPKLNAGSRLPARISLRAGRALFAIFGLIRGPERSELES